VTGRTWGGNLEIVHWNLAANRWIQPVDRYAGCVLLLATSEELPTATAVYRMLRNVGERGLLGQFPAVVVGLAKASKLRATVSDRADDLPHEPHQAILRALAEYTPTAMVVFGVRDRAHRPTVGRAVRRDTHRGRAGAPDRRPLLDRQQRGDVDRGFARRRIYLTRRRPNDAPSSVNSAVTARRSRSPGILPRQPVNQHSLSTNTASQPTLPLNPPNWRNIDARFCLPELRPTTGL